MCGTKDCRNCIHAGKVRMGKLCCEHPIYPEIIEPFEGRYPTAGDCMFYEDSQGNTNEEPRECPLCGNPVIVGVSGKGAVVHCPWCDLSLGKGERFKASEAIKRWNRRV